MERETAVILVILMFVLYSTFNVMVLIAIGRMKREIKTLEANTLQRHDDLITIYGYLSKTLGDIAGKLEELKTAHTTRLDTQGGMLYDLEKNSKVQYQEIDKRFEVQRDAIKDLHVKIDEGLELLSDSLNILEDCYDDRLQNIHDYLEVEYTEGEAPKLVKVKKGKG